MLRLIVLLLLIANGLFFAWSKGYFSQWGWTSATQQESFRLREQIEPERIVTRPMDTAVIPAPSVVTAFTSALSSPVTAPIPTAVVEASQAAVCLTAGAFNDKESSLLKKEFEGKLVDFRWRFETVNVPANWIIYMGKYPNINARENKKKELAQINVNYKVLTEASLEPGISLGSFESQVLANQTLQQLAKKGVRTARVLQEFSERKGQQLIVPAIDETNRTKLNALYAGLSSQLGGKTLQVCKK